MQPLLELSAGIAATCCTPLQYLEGAAYIAIVLAVFGVPQLLTYYLDRRDRRRDRREDRDEAEQTRREERAEAERVRREERTEAERRHHEMMTALTGTMTALTGALTAVLERNGHNAPIELLTTIEQLQQRIADLEAEMALLRGKDATNGED